MDLSPAALREGVLLLIILVMSLSMHEWGHAYVADKLGDDTPRSQGRVTFYPMAHLDWIGTVLIPALGIFGVFGGFSMIGWAKPVYINPSNYRRRNFDQALVTIAGPGVNLALAVVGTICAIIFARSGFHETARFCVLIITVNVSLVVFNLLPIPPLDGSKFLMYWFGMSEETYARFAAYGSLILIVLINLPPFRRILTTLIRLTLTPFINILDLLT